VTTAEEKYLFDVTIRRTFAPGDRWRPGEVEESTHPEFAEDADAIMTKWHRLHAEPSPFDDRYTDECVSVKVADAKERREHLAELARRCGWHPCCNLAVLRPCVCSYSTICPEHGAQCHGSHD
jgi:hypothetical protein